ncbi:MAG: DUF1674 domain-containing protein [Gammaproteobacteria bacterium]
MSQSDSKNKPATPDPRPRGTGTQDSKPQLPKEVNGPKGPEPTRYGDWEKNGRCIDF